jgi:predicted nucleic acid-binding protein
LSAETAQLYLIDTSVWIHALVRRTPITRTHQRVAELIEAKLATTTPIVRLELLRGARDRAAYVRIQQTLAPLAQLPLDDATIGDAAELGFSLRREGVVVPTTDLLIAASAIRAGAILVHLDAD